MALKDILFLIIKSKRSLLNLIISNLSSGVIGRLAALCLANMSLILLALLVILACKDSSISEESTSISS